MTEAVDRICANFEKLVTAYIESFNTYQEIASYHKSPISSFNSHPHPRASRFKTRSKAKDISNHQALRVNAASEQIDELVEEFLFSLRQIPLLDSPEIRVSIEFSADKENTKLRAVRMVIDTIEISSRYLTPKNATKKLRGFLMILAAVPRGPQLKEFRVEARTLHAFCEKTALLKVFAERASHQGARGLQEGKLEAFEMHPVAVANITDWDEMTKSVFDLAKGNQA